MSTGPTRLRGAASQQVFDVLMRTASKPGSIRLLPVDLLDRDVPMVAWLALALADVDVPVAANPAAIASSHRPLAATVTEATSAPFTELDSAWIALLHHPTVDEIRATPCGSALVPEAGARLAIGADMILSGSSRGDVTVDLDGPGVAGHRSLTISGIDADVMAELGRSPRFPAGRDAWFFTPDGLVAAIPRSTSLSFRHDAGAP